MKNPITREVLNHDSHILQNLHLQLGFDFAKPYFISKGTGSFTLNTIKNSIKPVILDKFRFVVLIHENGYWERKQKLKCVTGYSDSTKFKSSRAVKYPLDYFFSVGDFEETRKKATAYYFVIAQSESFARLPHEIEPVNLYTRYKTISTHYDCGYSNNVVTDKNGKIYNRLYFMHNQEIQLDKSGYYVTGAQADLHQRFNAYQAAKRKQEAEQKDYSTMLSEISAKEQECKTHLLQLITNAKTQNDIRPLWGYSGKIDSFYDLLGYKDKLESAIANKTLKSCADAEYYFSKIQKCASKILEEDTEK